jgi:hypothetical protein
LIAPLQFEFTAVESSAGDFMNSDQHFQTSLQKIKKS